MSEHGNKRSASTPALRIVTESERDPRALSPLDWTSVGFIAAALVLAPIYGGLFATPPRLITDSLFSLFDSIGLGLVLCLAAAGFLLMLYREWKRPVAVGAIPGLTGAMALFGGWAILSLIHTRATYLTLNALAALLAALMLGGATARLCRDRKGLATLVLAIVIAGSIAAALGVREYLEAFKQGYSFHRTFSTFATPGFLAGYLLLPLPITFAAFVGAKERTERLALALALALQSACLMLTGTRAALGIILVVLLLWTALVALCGAAKGRWKQIAIGLGIFVVMSAIASAPTRVRVEASGTASGAATPGVPTGGLESQGHSSEFRKYTWIGTVNMAKANPLFGTGLGTFEVAYSRYSETAFTGHAHNTFLQVAGETGLPGVLFLLTGIAAVAAFAAYILFLRPDPLPLSGEEDGSSQTEGQARALQTDGTEMDPRLLLAALLVAVLGSLAKSFIDSDWYIVATALTLSASLALLAGVSRDIAPLATQRPQPNSRMMLGIGTVVALFVLWRAGTVGLSRLSANSAAAAMATGQGAAALADYNSAAAYDPFDPESRLDMGGINKAIGRREEALAAIQQAVKVAPTGRSYYRLGQFYLDTGDLEKAIAALENSRAAEPRNLQNLRLLADTLRRAGKKAQAQNIFREMTLLETKPYGTVRAVPHRIETDFAYAHAGLADMAFEEGKFAEAADEYGKAAGVLKEFWFWYGADPDVSGSITPDKRGKYADLTRQTLLRWQEALTKPGSEHAADLAKAKEQSTAFEAQMEKMRQEEEKAKAATGGASSSP